RHFMKDRMERSGMRWTIESAQAMLDVRSTYLHGDWDDFMRYRIGQETQRLYPYRALVEPSEPREVIALPLVVSDSRIQPVTPVLHLRSCDDLSTRLSGTSCPGEDGRLSTGEFSPALFYEVAAPRGTLPPPPRGAPLAP